MASVIKTMLVAFLIVSLVHLATAGGDDKCKGPSDTTKHCTGNSFDYKCIVTKRGDAADTPMGCVTDANKNTCNKNQTDSGVTVKTCCCSGELCNADLEKCNKVLANSGAVAVHTSFFGFGALALGSVVSVFFF